MLWGVSSGKEQGGKGLSHHSSLARYGKGQSDTEELCHIALLMWDRTFQSLGLNHLPTFTIVLNMHLSS